MNSLHGSRGAATLMKEKEALRRRMRRLRAGIARTEPGAAERLADLCAPYLKRRLGRPGVAAGYNASGYEIDPGPLLRRLAIDGWRITLPRAMERDAPLTFLDADGPLTPDAFGMPAPAAGNTPMIPDIVLIPLLAFDARGGRLGQGAGCYDRTLATLRARDPVVAVGLAYAGQVLEKVPVDEHDALLDLILTERGPVDVIRAAP